jgi:threonine aldolase
MGTTDLVDLRSDTVTRPTAGMREAMLGAEVGDDVYGEDPTINELEARAAALLRFEAALFVPSGTMGNQIAVNLHSRPGSEVIVEQDSHVYRYELGAMSAWSGALPKAIAGENGLLRAEQISEAVAPDLYYLAPTTLLVLENSHNHAGGRIMPAALHRELADTARSHGLRVHLDGARIFNAAAALGLEAWELAAGVDSLMFCLSKGLGAPVGSMLCGSSEFISRARVVRKRMGGGMRQAGILAAAGLYALRKNIDRLGRDHQRARQLAEALADNRLFDIDPETVETNIVVAGLRRPAEMERLLRKMRSSGLLAGPMGSGRIRFATHLDIDDSGLQQAVKMIGTLA